MATDEQIDAIAREIEKTTFPASYAAWKRTPFRESIKAILRAHLSGAGQQDAALTRFIAAREEWRQQTGFDILDTIEAELQAQRGNWMEAGEFFDKLRAGQQDASIDYKRGFHDGQVHMLAELREAGQQGDGWRDIASAPRDGTIVMLAGWNRQEQWVTTGQYDAERGHWWGDFKELPIIPPTHWQPLPAAPVAPVTDEGEA